MQGIGILTASLVAIVTTAAFKPLILKDIKYLDYVWRIELGLGVVPALLTVYLRNKLPEPPQWTLVSKREKGGRWRGSERERERDERGREKSDDHFFFFFSLTQKTKPPPSKRKKKDVAGDVAAAVKDADNVGATAAAAAAKEAKGGGVEAAPGGARIPLTDSAELAAAGASDGGGGGGGKFSKEEGLLNPGDAIGLKEYLTSPSIMKNRNFFVLIGTCMCW